ncbi:hypothetical protein LLH23_13800 [bacterium]|nr:hypothetical protein [bacterium]
MRPVLVAVADDFSGASDQAGMLARAGVASLLVLDEGFEVGEGWEAVTVATRLRALPVAEARAEAARLLQHARSLQPHMIQYKYCSTFDSTPAGNIGPVLDVALDVLRLPGAIVMPALPINGRTTYLGYHFVHGVPLSESPMRGHPLNPMADASLVRWLQQQTPRRVGLVAHDALRAGPSAVRSRVEQLWHSEIPHAVLDCLDQRDVRTIAQAVADLPFISGSSALAMELPAIWRREGLLGQRHGVQKLLPRPASAPVLALAGSCAEQTLRQVAAAEASGDAVLRVGGRTLLSHEPADMARELLPRVQRALAERGAVVVASSEEPTERLASLRRAEEAGLPAREFGLRIERLLAELAHLARMELGVRHFICAGGETSGAIAQALGLQALEMVRELAPGVPLCRALPGRDVAIALKGGNFGGDGFFADAARMARRVKLGG